ncbi:PPC domain-containing protein, partial [cf. Phormidesmis sp. LEGE 11477]|uniref:PPC domain-containing protein n=1 Tax=cf. Phormidesmis sp. LEGE 11477 TaxID=1828680 RepID=UPI001D13C3F8
MSADNPTVSINGAQGVSGTPGETPARFLGFVEDVDFYSVVLDAGQTASFDIDTEAGEGDNGILVYTDLENVSLSPDTELRLFDAQGNELAANNDGAAPGEEFSRDPFVEYTATDSGTYYVGVSQLGNRNYDPFTEKSGSGWTFPE